MDGRHFECIHQMRLMPASCAFLSTSFPLVSNRVFQVSLDGDGVWFMQITSEIVETMSLLLLLFPVVRESHLPSVLEEIALDCIIVFASLYVGQEISPSSWALQSFSIALARATASSKSLGRSNLLLDIISAMSYKTSPAAAHA